MIPGEDDGTEWPFAMVALLSLDRLGKLFQFLDQHLGEIAIFDPDAKVKECTIRDALKVGEAICSVVVEDAKKAGMDPAEIADSWTGLVDLAITRKSTAKRTP